MNARIHVDVFSPAMIEKANTCTSAAELIERVEEDDDLELSDEQLDSIVGGYASPFSLEWDEGVGDVRDDIDEALVPDSFVSGQDLGDADDAC